jgi:hypothetical protein
MSKFKKHTLAAVAGVVLGAVLALAAALSSRPLGNDWPAQLRHDPGDRTVPPQMVLAVQPDDYGYRLGDQVPVTAYVRFPLNWKVDAGAAEMTGDFSELTVRSVDEQVRGNTNYVLVHFDVQSFALKPLLQGTISVPCFDQTHSQPYFITGTFTAGTSPTWDGRPRLMPASTDKATPDYWPAGLLLLVGLAGCCCVTIYATRLTQARPKLVKPLSPRQQQGNLFFAAWRSSCADRSDFNAVRSMDTIVRRWLNIEAVLSHEIPSLLGETDAADAARSILVLCEMALFAGVPLADDDLSVIASGARVLFPESSRALYADPDGNRPAALRIAAGGNVEPLAFRKEDLDET